MRILLKMALRNLRRNTRRTLLSMSSIAFGLAVVLWLGCILAGRNKAMIDRITANRTGHLQLHREDYLRDKLITQSFQVPEKLDQLLPAGSRYSPRLYLPSLISSGEQSTVIMLVGIDPDLETQVTNLNQSLSNGDFLKAEPEAECPSRQIFVGQALADLLKVKLGNKLVLMAQATDNTMGNDLFRVRGLFSSGSKDLDKSVAYAPINCVRKLGVLAGVHELAIHLPDETLSSPTLASLGTVLDSSIQVSTWKEAMPSVAGLLRGNEVLVNMISAILFIVITIGIINVLLIGVFERVREFGVMIALGTTPAQLRGVILLESFLLGLGASIIGTILGTALVLYHMKTGFDISYFWGDQSPVLDQLSLEFKIFPIFKVLPYVKSVLTTIFFVLLAGVYPAFRASRLKPVEAMRAV